MKTDAEFVNYIINRGYHRVDKSEDKINQDEPQIQIPEQSQMNKVTPEHIKTVIVDTTVDRIANTHITIVTHHLKNGAKAVGINYGTIDHSTQDWERGVVEATTKATEKVYELENYLLRQKLYEQKLNTEQGQPQ